MTICLLSLDLPHTGDVQRAAFSKVFKEDGWKRFRSADSYLEKSYHLVYDAAIEKRVKTLVEAAAATAGIEHMRFVVQIGELDGWCCQLDKIHGIYRFTTLDSVHHLKRA